MLPNLKKFYGRRKFGFNHELIAQTNEYFENDHKSNYLEEVKNLKKLWTKYMKLKGDYVNE